MKIFQEIRQRRFNFLSILVMLSMLLLSAYAASAQNSYYVAPNGNDNDNDTGSESSPWKTIQHAVDEAKPGDTIFVKDEDENENEKVYNEKVRFEEKNSGTSGNYVTLMNYLGDTPVIDGEGLSPEPDGTEGLISILNASHIRVIGFEIRNFTTGGGGPTPVGIYVKGTCDDLIINNNKIHDIKNNSKCSQDDNDCEEGAHGIGVFGTTPEGITNIIFDNNEVYECILQSSEAFVLNGNVSDFKMTNNYVHDNNNIGYDFIGFEEDGCKECGDNNRARKGLVQGNRAVNNRSDDNPWYANDDPSSGGFYVDGGAYITFEQNISTGNNLGFEFASEHKNKTTKNIKLRNNLIYLNTEGGISIGGSKSNNGNADSISIVNNTLYKNKGWGTEIIFQYNVENSTIKNNIFFAEDNEAPYENQEGENPSNKWGNNLYYNGIEPGLGNVSTEDPLLAAPDNAENRNFRIQKDSPAIDAGENLGSALIGDFDFDGESRVVNDKVDIGAHEFGGSGAPSQPAAPTNLAAQAKGSSTIDLSWDDNSNNETGFEIEHKTGSGSFKPLATVRTNVNTYEDNNLTASTIYIYRVRASNNSGNSLYSDEAPATTAPSSSNNPPSVTIASPRDNTTFIEGEDIAIKVNASDNDGTVTKVELSVDGNKLDEDTSDPYEFTWSGAAVGTYDLTTVATDNDGETSTSSAVRITIETDGGGDPKENLALGKGITASSEKSNKPPKNSNDGDDGSYWQSSSNNETQWLQVDLAGSVAIGRAKVIWKSKYFAVSYQLEVSTDGNSWTSVYSTTNGAKGEQEFTFSQVTVKYARLLMTEANKSYYRLLELEIFSGTPGSSPEKPTNLVADAAGSSTIELRWNDNSANETGFKIERKTGSGAFAEIASVGANVKTYTDNGLTASTTYSYRVRAYNGSDDSDYSDIVPATTAPSSSNNPPSVTIASPRDNTTFIEGEDIAIKVNASDNDGTVTKVELSVDGNKLDEDTSDPYEFTWSGAAVGTYDLTTVATDNDGETSTSSAVRITIETDGEGDPNENLALGKGITASSEKSNKPPKNSNDGDDGSYWQSSSNNETQWLQVDLAGSVAIGRAKVIWKSKYFAVSYQLEVSTDGNSWTSVYSTTNGAKGEQEFTFSQVTVKYARLLMTEANKSYYRLLELEIFSGTPGSSPEKPTNLVADAAGSSTIELRWNDNSDNETGFKIERKTGSGAFAEIASVGANVKTYTDNGLTASTTYSYRVRAYNGSDDSDYSDIVPATTAPSSSNNPPSVTIASPRDNTTFIEGEDIAIKVNASDNDGTVTKVELSVDGNKLDEDTSDPYEFTWSGAAVGTYDLTTVATDNDGETSTSSAVRITIETDGEGDPNENLALGKGITASSEKSNKPPKNSNDGDDGSYWQSSSNNETQWLQVDLAGSVAIGRAKVIWKSKYFAVSYQLEVSTDGNSWTSVYSTTNGAKGEQEFTFSQVTVKYARLLMTEANKSYYRLLELEIFSGTPGSSPEKPTNLVADAAGSSTIELRWNDNSANETGFKIERKTGSGAFAEIASVGANVKTYTDNGLTASTTYSYRVRAYNGSDDSDYSNIDNATTQSDGGGSSSITVDGDPSDWAGISALTTAGGQSITSFKVTSDATKVYFLLEGNGIGRHTQFFINSDNNSQTGYQNIWNSSGADYLIEDGFVLKAKKSGSEWDDVWPADGPSEGIEFTRNQTSTVVEVSIEKTVLSGLSSTITVGVRDLDSGWDQQSILPTSGNLRSYSGTLAKNGLHTSQAREEAAAANPAAFSLSQNFPNPFNPTTVISYSLPQQGHVTLQVFDLLGREIATLVNQALPAGRYQAHWNANDVKSGVYFYRLQSGDAVQVRRLMLVK